MLDALTLDQLRTFLAVAEAGSFRSAAARLARVQSAVSHTIASLEAELNVRLFDRTGYRPRLTPEGEALLANAREIILRVDEMRARARGLGEGVELQLSLVVDALFPVAQVGAALRQMRQVYPSVAVSLAIEPLGGPVAALIESRCTLAIVVGEEFRDPAIAHQALCSIPMVAVVAADHPLAGRNSPAPGGSPELARHLQIVLKDPTKLSEGREFGVLSPMTCRVHSQDAKYGLIRSGLGWGRLPLWLVKQDLQAKRLVRLDTASLGRNAQLVSEAYLAHRRDQTLGPAARAFASALASISDKRIN